MKLITLTVFCLFSICVQAQSRFAFQAGINLSDMNFNKAEFPPATHVNASWQTGVTLGLRMRVPLGDKLSLQPEYNFVQRNGSDQSTKTSYRMDYLSLPVLLHYKIAGKFSVYAGPQAELLIHASANNGNKTTITHDTEERSLAVIAGVECDITKLFFVSVRYMQGLNNIGIGQRSNVKEFKYQAAGITAGVRF